MSALSLLFLALPLAQPAADPLPAAPQVRKAVERSLPYMMKAGFQWKEKQCISCHHIPLAVWTHNAAKAQGFAVDQAKIDTLTDRMIGFSAAKKYPHEMVDGFLDTVFLARLSAYESPRRHAPHPAPLPTGVPRGEGVAKHGPTFEMFQQMLAEQQRPDGSWKRQDSPKEPGFAIVPPAVKNLAAKEQDAAKREAAEVDTMWTLLGLNALERLGDPLSPPARELLVKQRSAAFAFLNDAAEGTRSDWLAFRMLIERDRIERSQIERDRIDRKGGKPDRIEQDQGDRTKVGRWRQTLLAQQNKDGGWGLVRGDPSHPLVTGQALWALGIEGVGDDDTAVQRAWQSLLTTQREDGSWAASSRAIADHRNDVTENFGTGWATIGLLATMPAAAKAESDGTAR